MVCWHNFQVGAPKIGLFLLRTKGPRGGVLWGPRIQQPAVPRLTAEGEIEMRLNDAVHKDSIGCGLRLSVATP